MEQDVGHGGGGGDRGAQRPGGVHRAASIRLHGDQQRLLDAQPVFGALDAVFADVRERTEYD